MKWSYAVKKRLNRKGYKYLRKVPFFVFAALFSFLTFSPNFYFFLSHFPPLCVVLFSGAMMSAKMAHPTANNAIFVAITSAHTKHFTPSTPTTVANPMSRNPSCNGRQMERAFERHHAVSESVALPFSPN